MSLGFDPDPGTLRAPDPDTSESVAVSEETTSKPGKGKSLARSVDVADHGDRTPSPEELGDIAIEIENLNLYYGAKQALKNVSMKIARRKITALIGPSGCGKSTLLRCINRMNDLIDNVRITGTLKVNGYDIHDPAMDVTVLRKNVGMVFQKSNPFPKSIFENIAFGPRIQGIHNMSELKDIVEKSLHNAAIWDEVKDRLHDSALGLSGGQQQRLCIARAIAIEPEVLLMDEPCSALDPIATSKIEDLMDDLKDKYTIAIVTHNMQQAARCSDYTGFLLMGDLVEYGGTKEIFTNPTDQRTEDYITGRFG